MAWADTENRHAFPKQLGEAADAWADRNLPVSGPEPYRFEGWPRLREWLGGLNITGIAPIAAALVMMYIAGPDAGATSAVASILAWLGLEAVVGLLKGVLNGPWRQHQRLSAGNRSLGDSLRRDVEARRNEIMAAREAEQDRRIRAEKAEAQRRAAAERARREAEERARGPQPVPGCDDRRAEHWAAEWMRFWGEQDAAVSQATRDGGADVVSARFVAEVKHQVNAATPAMVRALYGVATHRGKGALFFSRSGYTRDAMKFGEEARMALFSYDAEAGTVTGRTSAARRVKSAGSLDAFPAVPEGRWVQATGDGLEARGHG